MEENIIDVAEDIDVQDDEIKADLESQLKAAKEQQKAKMEAAMEHTLAQCDAISAKYLTVNGFLQVFENAKNLDKDLTIASDVVKYSCCDVATMLSESAKKIKDLIERSDVDHYDDLLDNFIDPDFVKQGFSEINVWIVVEEALVCQLCQEVHNNLMDMVHFKESTDAAIAKLEEQLAELG